MVFGRRRWLRFSPKSNYYFLAHLKCSLKFACKFIPWYLPKVDKLTSKKYSKTINLLCAGKNFFVKYRAQGGLTPSLRTPLSATVFVSQWIFQNHDRGLTIFHAGSEQLLVYAFKNNSSHPTSGVQRYCDARGDCLIGCPLLNSSIEQRRMVVIVTGYTLFMTS